MIYSRHRGGVSLVALVFGTATACTSYAQTAPVPDAPIQATDSASATAPPVNSAELREIIVTGSKRNERLLSAPVAVTVFDETEISKRGINRPADFLLQTPNVTFIEDNAGEAFINIRGQTAVRNSDTNVAIVVDGVPLPSNKQFNNNLFDIAQIEVLKGPQSAIYGRNSAAGAIVITSKAPGDTLEGSADFQYGSFKTAQATLGVGGPLTDTLKFRLSGLVLSTNGPFTNITTGEHVARRQDRSARAQLLFQPNERLKLDLRFTALSSNGGGIAYNGLAPNLVLGSVVQGPVLDANNANLPFVSNIQGFNNSRLYDITLKADYDLGFATVTSITNYDHYRQTYGSDLIPYVNDTPQFVGTQRYFYKDRNASQELRLTSNGNTAFRWQLGGYYLKFKRQKISELGGDKQGAILPTNGVDGPNTINPTVSYDDSRFETENYAPFANAQFNVTNAIELRAAVRYDTERRSVRNAAPDALNPVTGGNYNNCVGLLNRPINQCENKRTFHQFTSKLSATYKIGTTASLYASYGRGFKSGGFNAIGTRQALINAAAGAGLPSSSVYANDGFDKEVSDTFEAGAKGRLFHGILQFDLSAFRTTDKNAQQYTFFPTAGLDATVPIDKVLLKGFDTNFTVNIPGGTQLFASYGYVDGKVKKFTPRPSFVGNVAPGSFKYTITTGASHTFEITDTLKLTPRVQYSRYGRIWWDVDNTPGTKRNPVGLVEARVQIGTEKWEISVWGKNLANKHYFQEVSPLLSVLAVAYQGEPRAFGGEFKIKF